MKIPLIEAARIGDLSAVKSLLEAKANVNEQDPESGITALMAVAIHCPKAKLTPLFLSSANSSWREITRLLCKYEANTQLEDKQGETVFDYCRKANFDQAIFLIINASSPELNLESRQKNKGQPGAEVELSSFGVSNGSRKDSGLSPSSPVGGLSLFQPNLELGESLLGSDSSKKPSSQCCSLSCSIL